MKKIYLTLLTVVIATGFAFGQTLMSDEDHRMMMNTYENNLNTVLTAEMPQGMTIDQFKAKIVTGELSLSATAQASIIAYAAPLKTYGSDFASAKGLTATTDAYKYFYSSFSPSTVIENGKLVESTPNIGLTGSDMWMCALNNLNTNECNFSVLITDKKNVKLFTSEATSFLTKQTGNIGILVMLNGLSNCLYSYNNKYYELLHLDYTYLSMNPAIFQKMETLVELPIDPFSNTIYLAQYGFSIDIGNFSYVRHGSIHSYSFEIINQEDTTKVKNFVLSTQNHIDFTPYYAEYLIELESETPIVLTKITELETNNSYARTSTAVGDCMTVDSMRLFYCTVNGTTTLLDYDYQDDYHSGNIHVRCRSAGGVLSINILKIVEYDLDCMSGGNGSGSPVTSTPSPSPIPSPSIPMPVYGTPGGPGNSDCPCCSPPSNSQIDGQVNYTPIYKKSYLSPVTSNSLTNPFIASPASRVLNPPCSTTPCKTSKEDLKLVFPNTPDNRLEEIANYINKHGKDFGIDTKEKLQHFLAQAGHESTNYAGIEFGSFTENLNYRVNKLGTEDCFERYFNQVTNPIAEPKKANPNDFISATNTAFVDKEKFANYVYNDANRSLKGKLGNVNPGDGFKYIGRGIFQLTGRSNYTDFNSFYQNNYDASVNLRDTPELLASDMKIAVISALWYFKNKVLDVLDPPLSDTTTCEKVTYLVNGGTKGLEHRKSLFSASKNHINCL